MSKIREYTLWMTLFPVLKVLESDGQLLRTNFILKRWGFRKQPGLLDTAVPRIGETIELGGLVLGLVSL